MPNADQEARRDAHITRGSVELADIAERLLAEDAGAALMRAALLSWERQHGRSVALDMASAALIGVHCLSTVNAHPGAAH